MSCQSKGEKEKRDWVSRGSCDEKMFLCVCARVRIVISPSTDLHIHRVVKGAVVDPGYLGSFGRCRCLVQIVSAIN